MANTEHIITSDGSSSLHSRDYNETYHSINGALAESQHVFIQQGLHFISKDKDELRIFEFGFGTGLNAWLTCAFSQEFEKSIYYETIELHPLNVEVWKQLNYADRFYFANNATIFQDMHQSFWNVNTCISPHFNLHKVHQDWKEYKNNSTFDLIYFDAFSPNIQEDLWTLESLEKIYKMLKTQGVLVSYCAKGQFRRDLKKLGFQIEKLPGPVGKREMTRAIKS